jgi:hypothetical protein
MDQAISPTEAASPSVLPYDIHLTHDLERLLRYASTSKSIEVPTDVLDSATMALQNAKSQLNENAPLTQAAELALFKAIDQLSPRVHPATALSLEIGELMEAGFLGGSERQLAIKRRVNSLIRGWSFTAYVFILLVFTLSAIKSVSVADVNGYGAYAILLAKFFYPIVLGALGACSFILRVILQGISTQTFVLRDGTTYIVRFILGAILGFMIPELLHQGGQAASFLSDTAAPFLAGYAVEPMFAALDNLVLTIRDLVGRSPTGAPRSK